jgi:hypothetical protein
MVTAGDRDTTAWSLPKGSSPARWISLGCFFSRLTNVISARLASPWRRCATAAGVEHGVEELEDGALVGGRELLDPADALEEAGIRCEIRLPPPRPIHRL